ncbi:PASTA domain-containing protein [Kribbella sp. C-35]|uniref:PASTA domain-containing protein n=1 Tax=Kribbella sp. C-35 TaxID=2789276 RepID=UPI00397D362F
MAGTAFCSLVLVAACGGPATGEPRTPAPTTPAAPTTTVTQTPTGPEAGVVPNVVGLNHQLAQDTMQAAGFYYLTEEDATGQGRLLINDRNWVVVSQEPAGGTRAASDTKIVLRSKKIGE